MRSAARSGVALFGALFSSRLTELLGEGADLDVTPEMIRKLPHGQQVLTAEAFSDAITRVFLFAVPLLFIAFVLAWFLKETPLRTASGQARRAVAFDMEFAEESARRLRRSRAGVRRRAGEDEDSAPRPAARRDRRPARAQEGGDARPRSRRPRCGSRSSAAPTA